MSVAIFTFRIHGDAFHLAPQTYDFRLLRFTLRFQPPHLFFRPFCHGSPRSVRRGLFHVFHPRRLRAHFLRITCHGRRAPFNGHGVWKMRPMSYRFDFFPFQLPHLLDDRFTVLFGRFTLQSTLLVQQASQKFLSFA